MRVKIGKPKKILTIGLGIFVIIILAGVIYYNGKYIMGPGRLLPNAIILAR